MNKKKLLKRIWALEERVDTLQQALVSLTVDKVIEVTEPYYDDTSVTLVARTFLNRHTLRETGQTLTIQGKEYPVVYAEREPDEP